MTVLVPADIFQPLVVELRQMSEHLRAIHVEVTSRSSALKWEGGGVEQFHTQLDHADGGFSHGVDVLDKVVALLGQVESELNQARTALDKAETFVMNDARSASDPGTYFHRLGWTQFPVLPPRYSIEWEDLAIRAGYRP